MDAITEEKRKWLKSIGAGEFPEPVKFIYSFDLVFGTNTNSNHFLSVEYLVNTPLEELQRQYEENKEHFKSIHLKKM